MPKRKSRIDSEDSVRPELLTQLPMIAAVIGAQQDPFDADEAVDCAIEILVACEEYFEGCEEEE